MAGFLIKGFADRLVVGSARRLRLAQPLGDVVLHHVDGQVGLGNETGHGPGSSRQLHPRKSQVECIAGALDYRVIHTPRLGDRARP